MNYLTNSERSKYRRCPRSWYYTYQLGRVPVMIPEPLFFGSAIGEALDAVWNKDGDPIHIFSAYIKKHGYKDEEKLLAVYYKGVAMLTVYQEVYTDDLERYELVDTEQRVKLNLGNVTLRGAIDKVLRDKQTGRLIVLDHKTSKDDIEDPSGDFWQIKMLDPQLVGYAQALSQASDEPVDMMYDVIRKHSSLGPKLRKGVRKKKEESAEEWEMRKADETETWQEYGDRVMADYRDNPKQYFKRSFIHRNKKALEEWREEFIIDAGEIKRAKERKHHPKVHGACGKGPWQCEYFEVCTDINVTIDDSKFRTKTNRHPELDGEGDKKETQDVII